MQIPVSWAHDKLRIPAPTNDEPVLAVAAPVNLLSPELRPAPGEKTPADKAALAALAAGREAAAQDAIDDLAELMGEDWERVTEPPPDSSSRFCAGRRAARNHRR